MKSRIFALMLIFSLFISACSQVGPAAPPIAAAAPTLEVIQPALPTATAVVCPTAPASGSVGCATDPQPVEISGTFQYTNEIIITYYVEHAVALTDMYGFVKRDQEWLIPVDSQFLGFMKIDKEKKTGTFDLSLPAQPTGKLVSVNPQGKNDKGVQIFAMAYSPNLAGGPYSEGDDPSRGWPAYLASVKTDSENKDEVTGGKLLVWSPDAQQVFPSDFGADGLLFTPDDPVTKVPQGYSVIDLDQKPFKLSRSAKEEMTLYEPKDAAIKDFSALSYKEAFDKMFETARKEYAFNGIDGKQPNWDKLYAELAPRVEAAGQKKDAEAFYQALHDFTLAFKDGHVGLSGGNVGSQLLSSRFAGGYGLALRQLDDKRVMVVYVLPDGPAGKAGVKPGAIVTEFNGKLVDQAIQAVKPPTGPFSMETTLRYEQVRYLVRGAMGDKAKITFTNPNSPAKTVELTAIQEQQSLVMTSPYRNQDPNGLPVEYIATSSGVGYIKMNSNYDDLNLIIRLFQRALTRFEENGLPNLIIDLRANSGGATLGLAGFLYDKEIPIGQLQYYSDKTGKFEADGPARKVTPNEEQFHFDKIIVLVDQACASACELEAYAFSQVPGAIVIGEFPTAGTEAEVSRGQFRLPEDMSLQLPTGRFVLPDGSIFLEGKGVQPTERVKLGEQSLLSNQDPVITKALELASQK